MAEFYTFEILVTNYKNIKCHKQEDYNFSIYCQGYLNSQQFVLHAAKCRILINVTNWIWNGEGGNGDGLLHSVKEWEKQLHVMQEPGVAVEGISGMWTLVISWRRM